VGHHNTKVGRIGLTCALAVCVLFAVGWEPGPSASERAVRAKGSHALVLAVEDLSTGFRQEVNACQVVVSGGGTEKAIRDFLVKGVEIVLAARDLTDEERSEAKSKGIQPSNRVVAWDGIGVIVHPQNPVKDLTLAQLARIFSGDCTSWKEVGGPDWPITILLISPEHAAHSLFRTKCMANRPYAADAVVRNSWGRITSRVSATRTSIGLCIANKAQDAAAMVKLVPLRIDESQQPVALSRETIADGSYPIRRPLSFIWDASAGSCTKQFIEYCFKQGVKTR